MTRCAYHGDDTTNGRCAVCDHLAGNPHQLEVPAELTIDRFVGTPEFAIPIFRTVQNAHASPWADLLEMLPTIEAGHTADLKVQTSDLRVWLSRCTTEDGEPFDRTIYVEALRGGRWLDMGYFDGDEDDPHPVGTLGDGWNATYQRLGVEIR